MSFSLMIGSTALFPKRFYVILC